MTSSVSSCAWTRGEPLPFSIFTFHDRWNAGSACSTASARRPAVSIAGWAKLNYSRIKVLQLLSLFAVAVRASSFITRLFLTCNRETNPDKSPVGPLVAPPFPPNSLTRVDIANADGNKVAACTAMQDVATRGFLISLGGRSRIRVVSDGIAGERAIEVPAPEAYALLQTEIVRAGRVTLTRAELDDLCAKVGNAASCTG